MQRSLLLVGACVAIGAVTLAAQSGRSGVITDASNGQAVPKANLRIVRSGAAISATPIAAGVSASNGRFELSAREEGILEVSAPGYATKRLRWPGPSPAMSIQLDRAATITAAMRDAAGTPIPAFVAFNTFHPGNMIVNSVRAPRGVAQLTNASSGHTLIVAQADGYAPAATNLVVVAGERYGPLNITLRRAATISGVVVDSTSGMRQSNASIVVEYLPVVSFGNILTNYISRRRPSEGERDFEVGNIIPDAAIRVHAQHGGRTSRSVTLLLREGERKSDLVFALQ
jgi:hypothetical protein